MYKFYKKPFLAIINYLGNRIEKKHFTKTPIYIGGCGRSGTTILLSILSSHPEIYAFPNEVNIFGEGVIQKKDKWVPKRLDRKNRALLTAKIKNTNVRWCEKTPSNVRFIKEIEACHKGNFKFINIVRDGRDVILSKHPTNPNRYWVNPDRWINDVTAGVKEYNNPNVYNVKNEDLMLDFKRQIQNICDFLEMEPSKNLLNWYENTEVKKNKAYFGKVSPLFHSSINKWKSNNNLARAKELLDREEAKELLMFYNYELNI